MNQETKQQNRVNLKDNILWMFMILLPKKALSRLAGRFASVHWPKIINRAIIRGFAGIFKINLEEMEGTIEDYVSLQAFFTRPLKKGMRPLDSDPRNILSPCDGVYGQSGFVKESLALQIKGKHFHLKDLLSKEVWSEEMNEGSFAVLYLSPRDYHRYHAPCDLSVHKAVHVPGQLWPVNLWAVRTIKDLFCVNERVVLRVQTRNAQSFAMVFVGATMVGSVKLDFDPNMTTNRPSGLYLSTTYENPPALNAGQEIGRFEFGSTIIMVVPKNVGVLDSPLPGTSVKMGQRIGILNDS